MVEEAKLDALQRQVDGLRNELKSKDAVIQSQKMIIEELRAKQSANHSIERLKNEILEQMELQFDGLKALKNGNQNGRGSAVDDVG